MTDYRKPNKNFIKTRDSETAEKLKHEGFTQIPCNESGVYMFVNDGKKLGFDVEKYGAVYTNILNFE